MSHVKVSFDPPEYAADADGIGTLRILEAVRLFASTASPELITEETGFIVASGDISGVLNAMHIIRNKGRKFYSVACRKRAEEYYKEDRYQEYIDLYKSILDK